MSDIKINMSLFVPHVFPNFTKKYVADAFADVGVVDRVDFVAKKDRDGKPYNAAYIHFNSFHSNAVVERMQDEIYDNGDYHMYHDCSEYYWIVLPNTAKKYVTGERKERINLNGAKAVNTKSAANPAAKQPVCPPAPKKVTYSQVAKKACTPVKLEEKFDEYVHAIRETQEAMQKDLEVSEEALQMAEIEAELTAEDDNLVSIDWRYVHAIEQENIYLHAEMEQLRTALINLDRMYQAEKAKVRSSNLACSIDL